MNTDSIQYINDIGQIIEAEHISYSFNTIGWQIVAIGLLLLLIVILIRAYVKYKKNAYRREAIININTWINTQNPDAPFLINEMTKKICIRLYGRRTVASLFGEEWFSFLNSTLKKQTSANTFKCKDYSRAIYDKKYYMDIQELNEYKLFMLNWAKRHTTHV